MIGIIQAANNGSRIFKGAEFGNYPELKASLDSSQPLCADDFYYARTLINYERYSQILGVSFARESAEYKKYAVALLKWIEKEKVTEISSGIYPEFEYV